VFDAAVHLGTVLALLIYFAGELQRLAAGVLAGRPADRRLAAGVLLGSIPAGVAGLAFQHAIETGLRSVTVVAVSTMAWALVLWWADRHAARHHVNDLRQVGVGRALVVGLAQPLALIPGTSRSGITLSAGLFAGLDRSTAARFAFLLGLPITVAAGLLETATLFRHGAPGDALGVLAIGVGTSFAAGLAAIRFLVGYLQRRTLLVFVAYRIVLGLLLLWLTG
jgi:undecaprenyl-diphosphatase